MSVIARECKICFELKPLSEFNIDSRLKDNISKKCKICNKNYRKYLIDKKNNVNIDPPDSKFRVTFE